MIDTDPAGLHHCELTQHYKLRDLISWEIRNKTWFQVEYATSNQTWDYLTITQGIFLR